MDPRSQYLVQALQGMAQPAQQQSPQGLSMGQMQQIAKNRASFEAQNPGQSYMMHGLGQMGQNVMNAPGNVMSGFQKLVQGLPGMGPQTPPY